MRLRREGWAHGDSLDHSWPGVLAGNDFENVIWWEIIGSEHDMGDV